MPGLPVSTALRVTAISRPSGETVLGSLGNQLLYDEEVPREDARITRQRRMAQWTDGSTWLWTSFRNQAGQGEGSSQLTFDQVIEPGRRDEPLRCLAGAKKPLRDIHRSR